MFVALMPLLHTRRLLLTLSLIEGSTVRAMLIPQKASETEDNAIATPPTITAVRGNAARPDGPLMPWVLFLTTR